MNWTEEIQETVKLLLDGGVILYPTDTIWGLGCDMMSKSAVKRIYSIKKREHSSPLILLVSSLEMLKQFTPIIHPRLENLLTFHKKPVTVIYEEVLGIPEYLKGPRGSVAIRVTKDPYCIELINALGRPVTSTSANISGQPFPRYFGEVQSDIMQQVDLIAQYRRESREERAPSVVVRFDEKGELEFVRL